MLTIQFLKKNSFQRGTPEYTKKTQSDKTTCAIIDLSPSDDLLEHVQDCPSVEEALLNIKNDLQRYTLLDKLKALCEFYTVVMKPHEEMLSYINRVLHFASIVKRMGVAIDSKNTAMAVLNGLSTEYKNLLITLDALEDEKDVLYSWPHQKPVSAGRATKKTEEW